jgi:hypothetical protein
MGIIGIGSAKEIPAVKSDEVTSCWVVYTLTARGDTGIDKTISTI